MLLPDAQPDYSALNEARLIRSGKTSLVPVFRSAHVIVYQLPGATPLITGAGDASVLWLYPTHIVALVDGPGRYEVRVRWSPYWRASTGCVWRGPDGMLRLLAPRAGLIDLRVSVNVTRGLETLTGLTPRRVCAK